MKSVSAWVMGLIVLGVMAGLALPSNLKTMQNDLQTRLNATLADPRYDGVVALVKGQEVVLYLTDDFKGNDGARRLKAAASVVASLKGLDGLTQQGGWWFGPVTHVTISDERVSLAALEATKGVTLHVPESKPAEAVSASSSSAPTAHDLALKCNGGIQVVMAGRTLMFTPKGDKLLPESEPVLDQLVAALRNCPSNIVISINGLARPGEDTGPQSVAFLKAQTIADGMVLRGYDPYRLTVQAILKNDDLPKDGQGDGRQVIFVAMAR